MRAVILGAMMIGCVIAASYPASAVNCDQVRRYLSTGRSVEDVADTMIISPEEVKKCQQADSDGDKKAAAKPDAKAAPNPQPKQ